MKIAVLGGSYNPIHIGHLVLADTVCKTLGYDRVLFIPVYAPPHKEMSCVVSAADRLEMVKAAVKGDPRFVAESCEIDRGGISYTWDTICYLEKKYGDVLTDKIGLVFGEDLIPDFDKWNHADELAVRTDLIIACRHESFKCDEKFVNKPSGDYGRNAHLEYNQHNFPYPHKIVENPRMDISSSEIRQKIAEDGPWRYLVSDGVFEYIKNGGLYGFRKI